MTISRIPVILGGLAVAALLVTPALAHRQGEKTAKVGKSPGLAAAFEETKRLLAMANRARRLLVLGRDLDLAESLVTQAMVGDPLTPSKHVIHSEILEAQGRYEEAKSAFRHMVVPPEEVSVDPSLLGPCNFMRYALLCRKANDRKEEEFALSRIPGETLLEKTTAAWKDAHKLYAERQEVAFLQEIRRLDPTAEWVGPALVEARRWADSRLAGEKKRALAIESGINP